MDRTLLERMVGAVVLVLLFVLFAPVLLAGSADGGRSGALPPAQSEGKRTEVIILNAPVNAPPRVTEAAAAAAVKPAAGKPATAAPAAATATPSGFAVQLGSFSARDNADRFAARIRSEGYQAFVVKSAAASGSLYRVYSGPAASRAAAGELAAKLQAAGHNVMVTELSRNSGKGSGG